MNTVERKKRLNCLVPLVCALPMILGGCLNSAVNTDAGKLNPGIANSDGVFGVSPWEVQLTWTPRAGTQHYSVYSSANPDNPVSSTPFTQLGIATGPLMDGLYKVYPVAPNGAKNPRPAATLQFRAWDDFSNQIYIAQAVSGKGIEVTWGYAPWGNMPATAKALSDTKMQCYFLAGGNQNSNPFVPAAIKVSAPLKDGSLAGGTQLTPLTQYTVGCEVIYTSVDAQGAFHVSRNTSKRVVTSSGTLDVSEDIAAFNINPIQISRSIEFLALKVHNGALTYNIASVPPDASATTMLFSDAKSGFLPGENAIKLDSPLINIASNNIYGGHMRLSGKFKPNGGVEQFMTSKEFYVKSADNPDWKVFPELRTLVTAQRMASSLATGDFDCDGIDDLAVGLESVAWRDPTTLTVRRTGVVIIYYGKIEGGGLYYDGTAPSMTRLPATSQGRPPLILIPDTSSSTSNQYNTSINFGSSLAVGNFNRDYIGRPSTDPTKGRACMDLAIGAPGEFTIPSGAGAVHSAGGSVYISYGSPLGMSNAGWQVPINPFSPFAGSCSVSPPSGADAANHPSGGTFPAPNQNFVQYNAPSNICQGTKLYAYSLEGNRCVSNTGVGACSTTPGNPLDSDPYFRTSEFYPFLRNSFNNNTGGGASFGFSVASGDFNNDGYDDLIVGAPNAAYSFPFNGIISYWGSAGSAFLYYGSSSGIYQRIRSGGALASDDDSGLSNAEIAADASHFSPLKILMDKSRRSSNARFGHSVGIANLFGTHDTTRLSGSNGAVALIGAPNHGGRGIVGIVQHNADFNTARGNPSSWFVGLDASTPSPLTYDNFSLYKDLLWGEASYSGFGTSIAVGNFRDPRMGFDNFLAGDPEANKSIGLQKDTRMPLLQAFAVGAPNGGGRVYVWTRNSLDLSAPADPVYRNAYASATADGGSTLLSTRVNRTLCDNASSCPGAVLEKPITVATGFGETLSTIRAPAEQVVCNSAGTCAAGPLLYSENFNNKWQPIFNLSSLDALLVGAPSNDSSRGAACLVNASRSTGLTSGCAPLSTPYVAAGDRFGESLTGGFYRAASGFEVFVGAPSQSRFGATIANRVSEVPGSGSLFYFKASGNGLNNTSSTDLAIETTDPSGADFLSLSSLDRNNVTESKYVGDLNCDTYADMVMAQNSYIGTGEKTELLVIYGSETGLVRTLPNGGSAIPQQPSQRFVVELGARAPHWINTKAWSIADSNPLAHFAGVGDVNGDGCDDLLVANSTTVLMYGTNGGLNTASPTPNPAGKDSLLVSFPSLTDYFSDPNSNRWNRANSVQATLASPPPAIAADRDQGPTPSPGSIGYGLPVHQPDMAIWNWAQDNGVNPNPQAPMCHGDFNGDGFMDIALGTASYYYVDRGWQPSNQLADPNAAQTFNNVVFNNGLMMTNSPIFVFYGSADGLQTTGPDFEAVGSSYSSTPLESNCQPNPSGEGHATCRPAMLFDPGQFYSSSSNGVITQDGIGFEPFRVWRDAAFRRRNFADTNNSFNNMFDRFGERCLSVGSVDGDDFDDLVIPLPHSVNRKGSVVIFRGSEQGLRNTTSGSLASAITLRLESVAEAGFSIPATGLGSMNNLQATRLGSTGAGVGDLNSDNNADFAVAAPTMTHSKGTGGVVVFYGSPDTFKMENLLNPVNSPLNLAYYKEKRHYLCGRPGQQCPTLDAAQLLLPSFNADNFGAYIDAAGNVNGGFAPGLLLSLPTYDPPGLTNTGASLVYFGIAGGGISGGHFNAVTSTYTSFTPSINASCSNRYCMPLVIVPEYVSKGSDLDVSNQQWIGKGGMVLHPKGSGLRYKFSNYGSRAPQTDDGVKNTSDILLFQRFRATHPLAPEFDHLGSWTVWQ